jgi:DNA-binding response OmpR family regulator
MSKRILDVGQCGIDGPRMTRMLESKVGVEVVTADSVDEAMGLLSAGAFDLVMVNREFALEDSGGVDLIRRMKEAGNRTPVMLVSDKPDAQKQAEAAGAVHGFGKSQLESPATVRLIEKVLGGRN